MLRLLIQRFDFNNIKKVCKSFFSLVFIFTVLFSFSLLLITIYHNSISQYYDSAYDYKITNFNANIMESIKKQDFVEDLYASRLVSSTIQSGSKEEPILLNLVDEWDKRGISYLGVSRCVKGNIENMEESGIILDVITARKLNLGIGDIISIYIKDAKLKYRVKMLIEPDASVGTAVGVCLYNSYFVDEWEKNLPDVPLYSILYVKTNDRVKADQYFYHEYVGNRMEGQSKADIERDNLNSNIKKIWSIEGVEMNMEFAPPVTIIISILGCISILVFIWRESSLKMYALNKNLAILSTMGIRLSYVVKYFFIHNCIVQFPAILVASLIVKKIIYDLFIINYYLPWRLVWIANLIAYGFTFITSFIVCIGVCFKFKKISISKILASE